MIASLSVSSARPLLAQPPCILSFSLSPLPAGFLDDLHSFDPTAMVWTLLSPGADSGQPPSARRWHGFASAGGKLYVYGGQGNSGTDCCAAMVVRVWFSVPYA